MIILSREAAKLRRVMLERPGRYSISEMKRELHTSKAGVARAITELEDAGLIRMEDDDG